VPRRGGAAAQGRDPDHSPGLVAFEGVTGGAGEAHVGGLDAAGVRVRRYQPEHGVGARERPVHHIGVAVRPRHDLDAVADLRGKAVGVADDHADRLAAAQDILKHLVPDEACRSGDDDHEAPLNDRTGMVVLAGGRA